MRLMEPGCALEDTEHLGPMREADQCQGVLLVVVFQVEQTGDVGECRAVEARQCCVRLGRAMTWPNCGCACYLWIPVPICFGRCAARCSSLARCSQSNLDKKSPLERTPGANWSRMCLAPACIGTVTATLSPRAIASTLPRAIFSPL